MGVQNILQMENLDFLEVLLSIVDGQIPKATSLSIITDLIFKWHVYWFWFLYIQNPELKYRP